MLSSTTEEESALSAAADAVLGALQDHTNAVRGGVGAASAAAKRARTADVAAAAAKRQRLPEAVQAEDGPLLQGFHFLAMDDALDNVLHDLRPVFVILYDLQLAWVRQLEAYQSLHPEQPLKVR
jgi:hypothetical protein